MEKLVFALENLGYFEKDVNDKKFSMNSFTDRLFYQKLIFLLTEKAPSLKYNFTWYLRGPYSPDLTNDLFQIEDIKTQYKNSFLDILLEEDADYSENMGNIIKEIRELRNNFENEFNKKWEGIDLEILASLVFINKYTYSECLNSKEKTIEEFRERKPNLSDKPLDKYWNLLEDSNFV